MKITRYQSKQQAEALQARCHSKLDAKSSSLRYKAKRYSEPIQHPTDGDWGILHDDVNHPLVFAEIWEEMTQGEKNNTEDWTSAWKPVSDI